MRENLGSIYLIVARYIKDKEVHTPLGVKAILEIEIRNHQLDVTKEHFNEVYEDLIKRL